MFILPYLISITTTTNQRLADAAVRASLSVGHRGGIVERYTQHGIDKRESGRNRKTERDRDTETERQR